MPDTKDMPQGNQCDLINITLLTHSDQCNPVNSWISKWSNHYNPTYTIIRTIHPIYGIQCNPTNMATITIQLTHNFHCNSANTVVSMTQLSVWPSHLTTITINVIAGLSILVPPRVISIYAELCLSALDKVKVLYLSMQREQRRSNTLLVRIDAGQSSTLIRCMNGNRSCALRKRTTYTRFEGGNVVQVDRPMNIDSVDVSTWGERHLSLPSLLAMSDINKY